MPVLRLVLALVVLLGTGACYAAQPPPRAVDRTDRTSVALDPGRAREGGDLTMGLSAEPDVLDPTTSSSLYTRYVMNAICEKLYDIDADGTVVPQLAAALPTLSDGGRSVSIPIRSGIRFADGTPLDAAAVRTTLVRDLTKDDSARASEMGPITRIDTPDEQTVVLRYETPFAPITAALADRAGMIMSPAALKRLGDDFGSDPTCVGPFTFVERVPQTSITVERDPAYYDAEDVHLDTITYRIITDANIRAANLRSGEVQVIDTVSPQDVDSLRRQSDVGLLQIASLGYQGITINVGNTRGTGEPPGRIDTPIAQDPRVRQALEHSIDRRAVVNSVFNNYVEPACSGISPDSEYASDLSDACPSYDPALSRRLLARAGVETPVKLTMAVSNTPNTLRLAQALQALVKDGGFELSIEPVEYSTLLDVQTRGDFQVLQLGWSGRIDPHGNLFSFLATGEANNYSGYSNQRVDSLLDRAAQETETGRRAALYGQVVQQVQRDDPIIYLYRQRNLTAYSTDVAGIATYADGVVRIAKAAFVRGGE